jgi:hypothetical protein
VRLSFALVEEDLLEGGARLAAAVGEALDGRPATG